jgi:hypothetical protein
MFFLRGTVALLICALILSTPALATAKGKAVEEPGAAVEPQQTTGGDGTAESADANEIDDSPEGVTQKAVAFGERFGPSWDGRENYSDRNIHEFVINGGDYLGENWKNTYYIGGSYFYHLNQTFAFGAQYLYSDIVVDKNTPFYQSLSTEAVQIATAQCMLNTPAAWRAGSKIFNMDFFFTLGVGAMQINHQWEPTGVIGGGARFYFPVPWISFRLDINSFIHMTPMGGGQSDLSGDVAMGGGISFIFPNRKLNSAK